MRERDILVKNSNNKENAGSVCKRTGEAKLENRYFAVGKKCFRLIIDNY